MRIAGSIIVLLFAVLPCRSQSTLGDRLRAAGIPQNSFSEVQLSELVDGISASEGPLVYFVYVRRKGDLLTGFPQAVRYNSRDASLIRAEIKPENTDLCCGSPEGIEPIDDYLLLEFHFNPSAASALVLNKKLELAETLYGIDTNRVAPNQIVFTENMVHFADVHQERLQFTDLSNGKSMEIYPLKNDDLRNRFEKDLPAKMPDVCRQKPELCQSGSFDESCDFIGGDGNGRFAFVCGRSANRQVKAGEEPETYFSDQALYIYAHDAAKGWVYCGTAISGDDARMLGAGQSRSDESRLYESVRGRCMPNLPVVPDMSTSDLSQFRAPSHQM